MRSRSACGAQLAELLHRHVLLRAGERAGDRLVEGVGQDLLGLLRGGVGRHDLVEGALHVEHHRVERAARRGVDAGDRPGGVVELGEAEGLGQPPRRVDGEDDDLAPVLGRPQPERGGRGGLADPAGAAADDDPGVAGRRSGRRCPAAAPSGRGCGSRSSWSCAPSGHPLIGQQIGELADPVGVDAVGQERQPVGRAPQRPHGLLLGALQAHPVGVVAGLGEQPAAPGRRSRASRPPRGPRRPGCRRSVCGRRQRRSSARQQRLADLVDDDRRRCRSRRRAGRRGRRRSPGPASPRAG